MIKHTKTIPDPSGIVYKLIFEDDDAIAEAVVYRYGCRGVICFSVQSGCRVGCSFCGTGKRFIRDLCSDEMHLQISEGMKLLSGYSKIQLMSMSMGEPMDNMDSVSVLIHELTLSPSVPEHDFFLSTVGLNDPIDIIKLVNLFRYKHFGLQFSLHSYDNDKRKKLLGGYNKLMDIDDIVSIANTFKTITGKRAYFNYICNGNETVGEIKRISDIVNGHHLTCSVLCSTKKLIKGNENRAIDFIESMSELNKDIELSMFNPEGQDTIGGGCGQLLYVQEKLRNKK